MFKRTPINFKKNRKRENAAQTFLEYTLLFGIVIIALVALTPMVRRITQSTVKLMADQIGNQRNAEQRGGEAGYLVASNSYVTSDSSTRRLDRIGVVGYDYNDSMSGKSNVIANLGFTERSE